MFNINRDEISYYAERELKREKLWLEAIKLDKDIYETYLKHPNSLEILKELQERTDDFKKVIEDKTKEIIELESKLHSEYRYGTMRRGLFNK